MAISQGALFPLASVACLENLKTNVCFNDVDLGYRVAFDSVVEAKGETDRSRTSEFAHVHETLLANPNIRGSRENVDRTEHKKELPDHDDDSLLECVRLPAVGWRVEKGKEYRNMRTLVVIEDFLPHHRIELPTPTFSVQNCSRHKCRQASLAIALSSRLNPETLGPRLPLQLLK
ncbi:hypothetical protein V8C35DRAFT_205740 [Trichoderma chlorosporum]